MENKKISARPRLAADHEESETGCVRCPAKPREYKEGSERDQGGASLGVIRAMCHQRTMMLVARRCGHRALVPTLPGVPGLPLPGRSPPPGVGPRGSSSASRGAGASLCSARSLAWRPRGGTGAGHFCGLGWTSLLLQEGKTIKAINPKLRNSLTCPSMARGWKSRSHTW